MVINTLLASGFQVQIGNAWLQGRYTDFTLKVQDTTFQCHRFILSACSEFFRAMLDSDMRESQQNSATITDIDKDTFSTILHALYTGEDGLHSDNIYQIWSAVHQLQISHLVPGCEDYIIKNITKDNFLKIFYQAKLLLSKPVLKGVENFMNNNFEDIRKTEAFLELPPDVIFNVVQSDDLKVSSEDKVLESILSWVQYDSNSSNLQRCTQESNESGETCSQETGDSRKEEDDSLSQMSQSSQATDRNNLLTANKKEDSRAKDLKRPPGDRFKHVERLFSSARLYLASPDCLERMLRFVISLNYPDVCELLIDAIMYRTKVERRHFAWPLPALHRNTSDMEHVMVFWNNDEGLLQIYRFTDGLVWNVTAGDPKDLYSFQGICVYDNSLLLSSSNHCFQKKSRLYGIPVSKRKVGHTVWTLGDKKWIPVMCPEFLEESVPPVVHGKSVYQLQNQNLRRFFPDVDGLREWQICHTFNKAFGASSSLIVFRDSFIIFPADGSSITWFDITEMRTRELSAMEGPTQNIVSFKTNNETYILQTNGTLKKVVSPNSEILNFEFITQLWTGDWTLRGALLFRDQLYIFRTAIKGIAQPQLTVSRVEGLFEDVKVAPIASDFPCWPMVIPTTWLKAVTTG